MKKKTIYRYGQRSGALNHQIHFGLKLVILFFVPTILVLTLAYNGHFRESYTSMEGSGVNFYDILYATLLTTMRIALAYVLSLFSALGLALLVTKNKAVESVLLPIFDVLESIPILAFFPLIITFFLNYNFPNGAALFILFMSMVWSIVFTVVGGIKLIPQDIIDAAHIYGLTGWRYTRHVLVPAVVPEIITGSILAVACGWDIVIVAEVLHVYIKNGTSSTDLVGIGSVLVNASTAGNNTLFTIAIIMMTIVIAITNIFIWQRLLKYADRFRFE